MRTAIFSGTVLAVICLATTFGWADDESTQRTISVSGEGRATSPPDMATIQTGVTTLAETARAALDGNSEAMEAIMQTLEDNDIAAKDIQTSNFSIRPEYQRGPRGQQQPEIIGYRVSNQVTVRVRNLPSLGKVLDALVGAGSNQLSGIGFGIDDPTGIRNQARNRAVADARSRAELYAQAAGVKVGKVVSISEQMAQQPRPFAAGRMMAAEGAGAVPVATGEQEISTTVFMVFELEDK